MPEQKGVGVAVIENITDSDSKFSDYKEWARLVASWTSANLPLEALARKARELNLGVVDSQFLAPLKSGQQIQAGIVRGPNATVAFVKKTEVTRTQALGGSKQLMGSGYKAVAITRKLARLLG